MAEAMSINFFSASFLSVLDWKLSGCHCCASFLYALMISCLFAFLRKTEVIWMDGFGVGPEDGNTACNQTGWTGYLPTPRIL